MAERLTMLDEIESIQDLDGGGRLYTVRGKIWGHLGAVVATGLALDADADDMDKRDAADAIEQRDALQASRQLSENSEDIVIVRGIASSTGVDSYGTEMTREALEDMRDQFRRGVAYAPTHAEREWHEIVGLTFDAEIRSVGALKNAADPMEDAFVLEVATAIDTSHDRGGALVGALRRGAEIGQSIGGWFLRVSFLENAMGEIERVFVHKVELDHLAATRTPSNGDSDLQISRDALGDAIEQLRALAKGPAEEAEEPEEIREDRDEPVEAGDVLDPQAFNRAVEAGEVTPLDAPEPVAAELARAEQEVDMETEQEHAEPVEELAEEPAPVEEPAELTGDPPEETAAEASADDATTRSEARDAEDTHTTEEIDMDAEALRALIAKVVGETLASSEARNAPAPKAKQVEEPAAAPESDERDREIAALKAKLERSEKLNDHLMRAPVRHTRAYQTGALHRGVAAEVDGELRALEPAEEAGTHPAVVRTVTKSRRIERVLKAQGSDPSSRLKLRDLRESLREVFNAADADGVFNTKPSAWR